MISRAQAATEVLKRRRARGIAWSAYADDPVGFARDVLRLTVWSRMSEMLEAIRDHDQVALRAGRKVSKSTTLVAAALWWAMARGGHVLMTSTTLAQVKGVLWKEVRRIAQDADLPFDVPLDPATGIQFETGGDIAGRTATHRENMQGYSGAEAMYVADEASGLAREIMEAIEGNTAGGGKTIMAGNPTRVLGTFYDAFHLQSRAWHGIRISSRESPNVTGESDVAGLAVPSWIERMEDQYGPESAFVAIHVDGEFPGSSANAVIPLSLVRIAHERWSADLAEGRLNIGVDVARSGDDETVVQARRGAYAYPARTAQQTDTYAVVSMVVAEAKRLALDGERPLVKVDVIGIGAGVYDVLKREHPEFDVRAVNVAERATAKKNEGGYARLRDQIWFAVREWLDEGGSIPDDETLRGDLIAPTFRFDAQGRYVVSSKDEIKEATGRSPDRADALALAIYEPPTKGRVTTF